MSTLWRRRDGLVVSELKSRVWFIYQDAATFFRDAKPTVHLAVLITLDCDHAPDDDTYRMLDLAMAPASAQESAVECCCMRLLAKADVCPIDQDQIVLLDKRQDPEPQLMEAIAAFTLNNRGVCRPGSSRVIAGITLSPIIYKTPCYERCWWQCLSRNAHHWFCAPSSGSDWTSAELVAYNVVVQTVNPRAFVGYLPTTISDTVDPAFISADLPADEALSDSTYRLVQYLDLATNAHRGQESDFAKELLRVLGFEKRGSLLRSRFAIPLTICGDTARAAQTDVCLVHGTSIILIIQEDKTVISEGAQVIAAAIAAFQYNNDARVRLDMEPLETMAIPAITMIGTRPMFDKIPVTQQLSDALISGQYSANKTVVTRCTFAPPSRRLREGMENLHTRREILKYYTAFKGVAEQAWAQFLI